jgi:hypothetical protein
MRDNFSIPEISARLRNASTSYLDYCQSVPDEIFFRQPAEKWSVAQQTKHLYKATKTGLLAFTLPAFVVRMVGGRPNRPSRNYDELVEKYKQKLGSGGKASKRYIPKPISAAYGKNRLLTRFNGAMHRMADVIERNGNEKKMDHYIVPHPLLGKITLRELCYFTIHHAYHHLQTIQQLVTTLEQK